ncbi:transposase [Methanophagales archaeon]|nr:MAG: transposase [Methanophagales archaeon]
MKVLRTEQIWIKGNENIKELCHLSKNIYNEANYVIRQEFFKTKRWIRYNELYKLLKRSENYRKLPAQTAQQILKIVDRNWKSFFNAMNAWKEHPEKFNEMPRPPKYKKKNGIFMLIFTNQQVKIKEEQLIFPKVVGLRLHTRIKEGIKEVRIIPKGVGYVVEIVYEKEVDVVERDKSRIAGIDLGVRNLVTIANNIGEEPIVVKGGVVKSINQFFNKEMARLQHIYAKQGIKKSKRMERLSVKRERKLRDFFHKASKFVAEWCASHNIGRLVIGYNKEWKQGVNLGKKNNQNFVQIPFLMLIQQIKYKAEERGIEVLLVEEDHTSKCSFLDGEPMEHREYIGKRERGLFRSGKRIINADVNAAYNIIRKAIPKAFEADGIEGVGLHPVRWTKYEIAQSILGHSTRNA